MEATYKDQQFTSEEMEFAERIGNRVGVAPVKVAWIIRQAERGMARAAGGIEGELVFWQDGDATFQPAKLVENEYVGPALLLPLGTGADADE